MNEGFSPYIVLGCGAGASAICASTDHFENKLTEFTARVCSLQIFPDVPTRRSEVEIGVNLEFRYQRFALHAQFCDSLVAGIGWIKLG
jgi:hypothetical protein